MKDWIRLWIIGGWGVDALLRKQTRTHDDLDVIVQQKDVGKANELGYSSVLLVGDSKYYHRFSFKSTVKFGIRHIHIIPDENVMVCELVPNAMNGISGTIDCWTSSDGRCVVPKSFYPFPNHRYLTLLPECLPVRAIMHGTSITQTQVHRSLPTLMIASIIGVSITSDHRLFGIVN